jgi:dTDP-4-dehydrorhamnose reductase
VFAAGDSARLELDGGHTTVMSCQHGRPMGRFAGHNAVCDLLGLPLLPLRIDWYTTILDLGPWGALYTEGWDRRVVATGETAKRTKRLINALRPIQPHLVFMSSVEVFDGVNGMYAEADVPCPLNFYGELKYEIEQYLSSTYPRSTIVRTGWNVGQDVASRCVVRLTYETLLKPGAHMAEDNVFSIIDAADTAEGLTRLSNADDIRKIHFAADKPLLRTDLARLVQKYSSRGAEMDFKPCRFAEIQYSEPRGRLNDLDNQYSKTRLGMSYQNAEDVVREKVALLDSI